MDKKIESKIALGTVQFGLDYGINNPKGKISFQEVTSIINYALSKNIDTLDTASLYGDSEEVLGKIFEQKKENNFKIISKLPSISKKEEVSPQFFNSLKNLKKESIYGYLFHDFKTYEKNPEIFEEVNVLKKQGYIQKLGFSLYYPNQLSYLLEKNIKFDLLQVPYNILDRRFESFFPILQNIGVEIHTRSVFLQGLLLIEPYRLNHFFFSIKNKVETLRELSETYNIPLSNLLLLFPLKNNLIDRVIIGVDSLENLQANLEVFNYLDHYSNVEAFLNTLEEYNEQILLPFNWKK